MSDEIVCERRRAAGLVRPRRPHGLQEFTPGTIRPPRLAVDRRPGVDGKAAASAPLGARPLGAREREGR